MKACGMPGVPQIVCSGPKPTSAYEPGMSTSFPGNEVAWNVCAMFETSKMAQVISKMYCDGQAKRDGFDMGWDTTSLLQWTGKRLSHPR